MAQNLWQIVSKGGIEVYEDPQQLWNKAIEYFAYCDMNPIKMKRTLTSGKEAGKKVEVEHTQPYSVKGMCLFCGINEKYLKDMSEMPDNTWGMVVEKILMVIYTQNVDGAMIDMYNPIIVSKLLGLDKPQDNETKATRVEIVDSISTKLANSESEVLQNLNQENLKIVKEKSENLQKKNTDEKSHKKEDENNIGQDQNSDLGGLVGL